MSIVYTFYQFHGTPSNPMEYSTECHVTPWKAMEPHGVPWNVPCNSMVLHRSPWSAVEYSIQVKSSMDDAMDSTDSIEFSMDPKECSRDIPRNLPLPSVEKFHGFRGKFSGLVEFRVTIST